MKRILLTTFLIFQTILNSNGQPRSVGVRVGGECQISYQHTLGCSQDFLEIDMGVQSLGKGLNVAGAYNFRIAQPQWTERGEWGVFVGPAVKAAYVWMGGYLAVGVAMEGRCVFFFGGEALYGAIPALALRYRF